MPRVVPSSSAVLASLLLVSVSWLLPGRMSAQPPPGASGVLARPEAEVVRWAQDRFQSDARRDEARPAAWRSLERGSFDDFMARPGADFVRVFPGTAGGMAVAATWSRIERPGGPPLITCRVELRDPSGGLHGSFEAAPYLGFDVAPDGSVVIGHGELAPQAIEDGVLHTTLTFYAGDGKMLRQISSLDFSPQHSTAILASPRVFVLGVAGLVLGYDLDSGREVWRRKLDSLSDRVSLLPLGPADRLAVLIATDKGQAFLWLLGAKGDVLKRMDLAGRPLVPGGLLFAPDAGLVVVQDIVGTATRYHLLNAADLKLLKTVEYR